MRFERFVRFVRFERFVRFVRFVTFKRLGFSSADVGVSSIIKANKFEIF